MKTQTSPQRKKQGGFFWWLLWIAVAISSFIFSAVVWTWFIGTVFGPIQGSYLTILWAGAVFGSWLLTMIPIVRAKERYWNRLSQEDETNVTWWIGWIALTIATFFTSAGFWTWFFAKDGGSIKDPGVAERWVFAVFGTWMIALVPMIVVMYRKVERAYEQARQRREQNETREPKAKTLCLDPLKRILREPAAEKLKKLPVTIKKGRLSGHVVTAVLQDGRKFENVFVMNQREILGIYGRESLPFEAKDVVDFEPVEIETIPSFSVENWLRLDGRD
jgi:uncharacterized membrane protein